jgi:hypothetical protein
MVPVASSQTAIHAPLRTRIVDACNRDLSRTFVLWLLREPAGRHEFTSIATAAAKRRGADQDFQTVAILGFAADAGLLSDSELTVLKEGLGRLVGRAPVVNGVQLGFSCDPVGILGIALGADVTADPEITRPVADWAARFLKSGYTRGRAEDWERCVFAAADRKLGSPLGLPMPTSAATADVRMALLAVDLVDQLVVEPRQDGTLTLALVDQELPEDFNCERAALRLKALEWTTSGNLPVSPTEGIMSGSDAEALRNGPDVHVFWGPYWTGGILSLRNEGMESAKNVRLRCSTESGWRPILRPDIVASISAGATVRVVDETGQTQGHGQSIADFVHSLPSKEHTMTVTFEDRLGVRRARDFRVVAVGRHAITESLAVVFYAGALNAVATTARIQPPRASGGMAEEEPSKSRRSGKQPTRRHPRYKQIDAALIEISQSRPRTQEEVFQSLDNRRVPVPPAEPFLSGRGWMAGFGRDRAAARAWLSKRWSELNLLPFQKGPKSSRK